MTRGPARPVPLPRRAAHLLIAAAGLAGLLLQYRVVSRLLAERGTGTGGTLFILAGYFTILTNLLLAAVHGVCLAAPASRAGRFLSRAPVQGGLLLYILIVGLIYASLLAGLWNPQGEQWWADTLLHRVTPLLQLAFWLLAVPKVRLPWQVLAVWLAYPVLYLAWVFVRGSQGAAYPYPFIDLEKLGPGRTLVNSLLIGFAFLAAGALIIGAGRALAERPGIRPRKDV